MVATTREDLITAAGSHFAGSSHLEELGDNYTTYSQTTRLRRASEPGTHPCPADRETQATEQLPGRLGVVLGIAGTGDRSGLLRRLCQ